LMRNATVHSMKDVYLGEARPWAGCVLRV